MAWRGRSRTRLWKKSASRLGIGSTLLGSHSMSYRNKRLSGGLRSDNSVRSKHLDRPHLIVREDINNEYFLIFTSFRRFHLCNISLTFYFKKKKTATVTDAISRLDYDPKLNTTNEYNHATHVKSTKVKSNNHWKMKIQIKYF